MAWPPALLPVNRTNATPQLDVHPSDHNAIGQAVNDIVYKLGNVARFISGSCPGASIPSGSAAQTASVSLPPGIWTVQYTVLMTTTTVLGCSVNLHVGGIFQRGISVYAPMIGASSYASGVLVCPVDLTAFSGNTPITLRVVNGSVGVVNTYPDPNGHWLYAIEARY